MNTNIYVVIIIFIVVPLFLDAIVKSAKKAERDLSDDDFIIRQSKIFFWLGIVCSVFFMAFTILMAIFPDDTATWPVYAGFIAFGSLGAFIVYYSKVWKVVVSGDTITYAPVFKKPRIFSFEDISTVKQKSDGIIVCCGSKRVLRVDIYCVGYRTFVDRLKVEGIMFC